ncbi:hypothetical protein BY996DRAFT_6513591 [Phakopsora pachyrhizi]|nr:hypothetical protein BY996DRAFT_6513591 [Phakopsora pachyrhizi]
MTKLSGMQVKSPEHITPISIMVAMTRAVTRLGGNGKDRGMRMIKHEEIQFNLKEEFTKGFEEHQMKILQQHGRQGGIL